MTPRTCPSPAVRAFTLVELMVAMAITLLMVSFFLGFTTNSLKNVNRTAGLMTTESQASFVLDLLDQDLSSAVMRRDGRVWMAVTIQPDQENTGDSQGVSQSKNGQGSTLEGYTSWRSKGEGAIMKPLGIKGAGVNKVGSSLALPAYKPPRRIEESLAASNPKFIYGSNADLNIAKNVVDISRFRFGQAGVWLRLFTFDPQKTDVEHVSAPRAVGYQIVRMRNSDNNANESYRYYLMRSTVRTADTQTPLRMKYSTFGAGYDFFQKFATSTSSGPLGAGAHTGEASIYNNPTLGGLVKDDAGTIRQPNINQVIAENVIDFGLLVWGRTTDPDGRSMDVLLFPSSTAPDSRPNLGFAVSTTDGFTRRDEFGKPYLGITPTSDPGSGWRGTVEQMSYGFAYKSDGNPGTPDRPCTPAYVDIFLRILDAEGARMIDALENPMASGGVAPMMQRDDTRKEIFYWRIVEEHSHVFTRRIQLPGVQP